MIEMSVCLFKDSIKALWYLKRATLRVLITRSSITRNLNMLTTGALIVGALLSAVEAAPSSVNLQKRCGVVGSFYNQQYWDYDNYGTGDWLNYWWDGHTDDMSANSGGFAGAFGNWALGDPDWSCRDDGSDTNCDLKLCDNRVLNELDDARQAYYVLESVNRLHSYFSGLSESFVTSGLDAALSKDNWAKTFYEKDDDEAALVLKEVLNGIATVVGMGAALAGLAVPGLGEVEGAALTASAGAGSAMFTGAVSGFNLAGSSQYVWVSYSLSSPVIKANRDLKNIARMTHLISPRKWVLFLGAQ